MNKVDYIIVGQGIAGTTLAYRMLKAGLTVRVFDPCLPTSPSRVAAGIVNPITGRKLVKSWMIDDLLPEVQAIYSGMEELLGMKFLHEMPIYKLLQSAGDENDWMARRNDDAWLPYMSEVARPDWKGVRAGSGIGTILNGYWLDMDKLIMAFRSYLQQTGSLVQEEIDLSGIQPDEGGRVRYGDIQAKALIFCEGYKGIDNPYFEGIQLSYAKGEIMTVRCPELSWLNGILNRNGFVIPMGEDVFKVGATFHWHDRSEGPTAAGEEDLRKRLENLIDLKYEVLEVSAGFRPTVKDRRPLLGVSGNNPSLYMFNGLGTKGVSLSAYFSRQLFDHLESGRELMPEVDITRYTGKLRA